MLAAILSLFSDKPPHQAVAHAAELWSESGDLLDNWVFDDGGVERLSVAPYRLLKAPVSSDTLQYYKKQGVKFPAKLDDFLRVVVDAKTPADSFKRLRDFYQYFYQHEEDPERKAIQSLEKIKDADKQGGYFDVRSWLNLEALYSFWWQKQKSIKARASANQRKWRS